ncbi:MAG: 5'-deoxynucleotidase HD superfamily hydrolase [Candidatus Methanohalarchaeum thermophilum]|uniref:5'-deoxynucleotidase n=1 Tax=Methanohalarchaeum thermophilum TaxID=1903181 RepID=A0A1Q6DXU8_METT1|nr:MAG: 5'-deoxynucleotidase HD superfamily hydrolase [Candidatus Methanohalarchaeum thermophilum]
MVVLGFLFGLFFLGLIAVKGDFELVDLVEVLKRRKREGWEFRGVPGESIAEHIFGTIFFSYLIGLEIERDLDWRKLFTIALVHDLPEALVSDLDKVSQQYIYCKEEAEKRAVREFGGDVAERWGEYSSGSCLEAEIVKEADKLDMYNRAVKLIEIGYSRDILGDFLEVDFSLEESEEMAEELVD